MTSIKRYGDIAIDQRSGALFTQQNKSLPVNLDPPAAEPTTADDNTQEVTSGAVISPWGSTNDLPQKIATAVKTTPILRRALKFRCDAHYGKGLVLLTEPIDEKGKIVPTPVEDKRWNDFFQQSGIANVQKQLISDYETFRNQFIEIILNTGRTEIVRVRRLMAMNCRFEPMDKKTGRITRLHYSANWRASSTHAPAGATRLNVLNVYDPLADLRSRKQGYKFVLPIRPMEFDHTYYDTPVWDPVRETWVPVAQSISRIKDAIMRNQMVLKYHVQIPYGYWKKTNPNWDNLSDPEKLVIQDTIFDALDDFLSNQDNAGKSFFSHYGKEVNEAYSVDMEEWKITPIDDKFKKDYLIPDAIAANGEILTATGVDPALLGGFLPGGSESGSGSNKREAYWIHQAQLSSDREYTTDWFHHLVRPFNNWPAGWRLRYMNIDTSETLDKNPTGTKTVV